MNLAVKGALFNALLFPGWGHIYLKRYKRGIFIIIGILAGIFSIVWSVAQTTINILKTTPLKKGTVDIIAVYNLTSNTLRSMNVSPFFFTLSSIILLWILSIIDAYRIGKEEMAKTSILADQESVSPED